MDGRELTFGDPGQRLPDADGLLTDHGDVLLAGCDDMIDLAFCDDAA